MHVKVGCVHLNEEVYITKNYLVIWDQTIQFPKTFAIPALANNQDNSNLSSTITEPILYTRIITLISRKLVDGDGPTRLK